MPDTETPASETEHITVGIVRSMSMTVPGEEGGGAVTLTITSGPDYSMKPLRPFDSKKRRNVFTDLATTKALLIEEDALEIRATDASLVAALVASYHSTRLVLFHIKIDDWSSPSSGELLSIEFPPKPPGS